MAASMQTGLPQQVNCYVNPSLLACAYLLVLVLMSLPDCLDLL